MMVNDKVESWWIGVVGWKGDVPVFANQKVSATTAVDAMTQYDLLDVECYEVIGYVDDNQLYCFDDE